MIMNNLFFFAGFLLFFEDCGVRTSNAGSVYLNLVRPLSAGIDADKHHLHIREIEVYDVNNNKVSLEIDSFDSEMSSNPSSFSIDGDLSTVSHSYYPEDITKDHFIKYSINNMDNSCHISYIKIYNRDDNAAVQSRFVGSYLQIMEDTNEITKFDVTTDESEYTFDNPNKCLGTDGCKLDIFKYHNLQGPGSSYYLSSYNINDDSGINSNSKTILNEFEMDSGFAWDSHSAKLYCLSDNINCKATFCHNKDCSGNDFYPQSIECKNSGSDSEIINFPGGNGNLPTLATLEATETEEVIKDCDDKVLIYINYFFGCDTFPENFKSLQGEYYLIDENEVIWYHETCIDQDNECSNTLQSRLYFENGKLKLDSNLSNNIITFEYLYHDNDSNLSIWLIKIENNDDSQLIECSSNYDYNGDYAIAILETYLQLADYDDCNVNCNGNEIFDCYAA